jgi:hypothetical protein
MTSLSPTTMRMRNRISGAYSGVGDGDEGEGEDEDKDEDEGKDEGRGKDKSCSLVRRAKRLGETRTGATWHGGV